MLGRRTAQPAKVRWVWRMTDTAYRVYMEHRRPIWGTAVAVLAAVSLFVGFRYAQSRYTASSLQDALQRADGRTLLSMCFERERSLLQVSPKQVGNILREIYGALNIQRVVVQVREDEKDYSRCQIHFIKTNNDRLTVDAMLIYQRGRYRLYSLSQILYDLTKQAIVAQTPMLQGEATDEKRLLLAQAIRQFLEPRGIKGVFQIDLRNHPDVAWRILKEQTHGTKYIDFDKHTALLWPEP